MKWPFRASPDNTLGLAARNAVDATVEQAARYQSEEENEQPFARLTNLNGFLSGYALGIASTDVNQRGSQMKGNEERLADLVQAEFAAYELDIHVWKHAEHQSAAFVLGVMIGGQEQTNRVSNVSFWNKQGARYNILHEVLPLMVNPYVLAAELEVNRVLTSMGCWLDQTVVQRGISQLRSEMD